MPQMKFAAFLPHFSGFSSADWAALVSDPQHRAAQKYAKEKAAEGGPDAEDFLEIIEQMQVSAKQHSLLAIQGAATPGSSLPPVATIRSEPSGSGRCKALASSHGARIHTSCSSALVKITGIAFGCTRPTSAFGSVVRKAKMSVLTSPSFAFRTLIHFVQSPAKHNSGRVSSGANHTGVFLPSIVSYSENDVNGARQRFSGPARD